MCIFLLRSTPIALLIPKEPFNLTFSYEVLFGLFLCDEMKTL